MKSSLFSLLVFAGLFNCAYSQNLIKDERWASFIDMTPSAGTSYSYEYYCAANWDYYRYYLFKTDWGGEQKYHSPRLPTTIPYSAQLPLEICESIPSPLYRITPDVGCSYVFKTYSGDGRTSPKLILFRVFGRTRNVVNVTRNKTSVYSGQTITVTAALDSALNVGQVVYLRYTNDAWANSGIVRMSGAGTSYSANIPDSINTSLAAVRYYVFTTGSDVTVPPDSVDFYTINMNNNSGSNYGYTVHEFWTSVLAQNWNDPTTWDVGEVPPSNGYVTVKIASVVTQNVNVTVKSLTVAAGYIFVQESGTHPVLSIANGGTINIQVGAQFMPNDGKVLFLGSGAIIPDGMAIFYDMEINGPVDMGNTPNYTTTINGTLTLKPGGSCANSHQPAYGSAATLRYEIPGDFMQSTEWRAGTTDYAGPYSVDVVGTHLRLQGERAILHDVNLSAGGSIELENGRLVLSGYSNINGDNDSSYIKTTGTYPLVIGAIGTTRYEVKFPVGTSTTYNPVTINNSGAGDEFSVRVKNSFTHPPLLGYTLNKAWEISEAEPGGSNCTLTFQWNSSTDENSGFNRTSALHIGRYTGTEWFGVSAQLENPTGNTYTASASGFSAFSEFSVGSTGALPVELESFSANCAGKEVRLKWRTAMELNNVGFELQRSEDKQTWRSISFINGHGNSNSPVEYTYSDNDLPSAQLYYRLKQIDNDGSFSYSKVVEVTVYKPAEFILEQNFPNPFNPVTKIAYSLPNEEYISLRIYSITGELVYLINKGLQKAGYHTIEISAEKLESGVYVYSLSAGAETRIRKMIVLK